MRRIHILMSLMAAAAIPSAGDAVTGPSPRPPAVCFRARNRSRLRRAGLRRSPGEPTSRSSRCSSSRTAPAGSARPPTAPGWSAASPPRSPGAWCPTASTSPAGFAGDGTGPSNLRARLNGIYGSQSIRQPIIQQALDEVGHARRHHLRLRERRRRRPADPGGARPAGTSASPGASSTGCPAGSPPSWRTTSSPTSGTWSSTRPTSFFDNTGSGSAAAAQRGEPRARPRPRSRPRLPDPADEAHGAILQLRLHRPPARRPAGGQPAATETTARTTTCGVPGTDLGPPATGPSRRDGNSIDGVGDPDFYRSPVTSGKQVDVTLTPIGSTYLQGPQQSNGNCTAGTSFNSLVQNDASRCRSSAPTASRCWRPPTRRGPAA